LRPLGAELLDALRQLVALVSSAFAIDLGSAQTILRLAMVSLGIVERAALECDVLSRLVFLTLPLRELFACDAQLVFTNRALARGLLAVGRHARAVSLSFVSLELRPLATSQCVALALFGDSHLAADLLHALALRGHEAEQLGALRVGGCAVSMCRVARVFRGDDRLFCLGRGFAKRSNPLVEPEQLVGPRFHLALCQSDLDREPARRELGMSLRALPLPG
jgi:hypothetical protein